MLKEDLWVWYCGSGKLCKERNINALEENQLEDSTCSDDPHSLVHFVDLARVKEFRTDEEVARWEKFLETKDEQYLDEDRQIYIDNTGTAYRKVTGITGNLG